MKVKESTFKDLSSRRVEDRVPCALPRVHQGRSNAAILKFKHTSVDVLGLNVNFLEFSFEKEASKSG